MIVGIGLAIAGMIALAATADTEDEDTRLAKISQEELQYEGLLYNKADYRRKIKDKNGNKKVVSGTGYVKKSDLDALNLTTVPIPANFAGLESVMTPTRLREQLFEIVDIDEEEETVTITARHIWYTNIQNNTLWKPTNDATYTAAAVCRNVMTNAVFQSDSHVATDCTDTLPAKELDFERKNLVEAFLDPEKGICKKFGLSLIRDNMDFYCLKNVGYDRGFVVERGKNLLGIERTESIENIATRVAPIAKDSKGNIVWMNHNGLKYIDSQYINSYSSPRLEIYDTGLQIGKNGVTTQNVQAKLLEAAQKRFSEDEVDKPEVTMTIEFISLGDTEEYKQYRDLDKVYLYDILTVKDEVKGYNYSAQIIGVEHDILTGRLNSVTIGSLKQADATRKIAVWQVPEVDGTNIRLASIQAGAFEAGAIQNSDLARNIITADLIDTTDLNAINATLGTATIADARIAIADIGFAQIKDADVQSLIAHDAITDRYYINKLQVTNLQAVNATVGGLVIKASDNKYYRLDIDENGELQHTEVTPTSSQIAAGAMGTGAIIETDLTVQDLAAANVKAINALIDKLTASRIDVNELFARQAFINKLNTTNIESTADLQIKSGGSFIVKTGGIFSIESGNFSVNAQGNVSMTGSVTASSGKIGGFDIGATRLTSGSGTNSVGLDSGTANFDYAIWAGNETASSAPFRLKRDGTVTLTKLMVLGEDSSETEVNLRTAGLWKLSYATVKSISVSGNTLTISTTAGTTTFSKAATTAHLVGGWSGNTYEVYADNDPEVLHVSTTLTGSKGTGTTSGTWTINAFDSNHKAYGAVAATGVTGNLFGFNVDATSEYNAGVTAGTTAGYNSAKLSGSWSGKQWLVTKGTTGTNQVGITLSATISYSTTTHKYTAKANADGSLIDSVDSGTQAYDAGVTAGNTAGYNSAKLSGSFSGAVWTVTKGTTGTDSVSLTLSATASISYDPTTHKYTATGKARASNADRASATAESGTEAYADGQKSVTASTGSWSNGSRTITLSSPNTNSYTVTVGNASGWNLSNTADKTAVASVTVAGKTFTNTFTQNWINHGDYNQGWNEALSACGIPSGGTVTVGGTYYANLYVMNQSGPSRVGYGIVGYDSRNTVQTK